MGMSAGLVGVQRDSMSALGFLTALYGDAEGYLTIWTPDKRTHWFKLPEALRDAANFTAPRDVYFGVGLGSRMTEGRLKSEDITTIPGLWMDVDLAGPAHKQTNLPASLTDCYPLFPVDPTIVVSSGAGIHCYWCFKEPLEITDATRQQAQLLLTGFQSTIRNAAAAKGWKLDSTHDLARILRLPGTLNYKSDPPRPVTIISHDGPRYNLDDLEQFAAEPTQAPDKRPTKFTRNSGDGPAQAVIDGCVFVQACMDHAAELSEPQWLAMISNVARCSDGPDMCHELSKPYPGYSFEETEAKIAHALNDLSPQTCSYIRDTLGFNQCPTGCGVKAPCAFALRKQANPVPEGFFDEPTATGISRFTDLGNAEYFSQYYAGKILHCSEMDKWLIWDGKRWKPDGSNQIGVLAGKCVRSMYDLLSKIDDDGRKKQLFKHAINSESSASISAMTKLARGYMSVSMDELDNDTMLINTPSGILDLKTGALSKHDPARRMTKIINATFDERATCPTFKSFLESTFDDNQNVIGFMRRFLGYCLTGDTREQQFVIAWGSLGRNGKGTLLNLIADILNDYAKATPSEVLYAKKYDKPSNDIARLAGARFVLASEGERGKRLDEPLVKKMTGQDILAARFLYRETFEFMPQFKLIMMTNDKPNASEDDAALWARIQLVPFTRRFDGDNQDKNLKAKLSTPAERSGILNWLLRGCLEWQREGLNPPEEVVLATQEYRKENDKLQDWIDDCCVLSEVLNSNSKDLYKSFQSWNLSNGEKFILQYKHFIAALTKKDFRKSVGSGNLTRINGIALAVDNSMVERAF